MTVEIPATLYKAKYELENLTSEELIDAHNDLIDFFQKLKLDVYNQISLELSFHYQSEKNLHFDYRRVFSFLMAPVTLLLFHEFFLML